MTWRTQRDRRPAPPLVLPGPDQLDLTARQVRLEGAPVHRLAAANTYAVGRVYSTDCGRTLFGADGAFALQRDGPPWLTGRS